MDPGRIDYLNNAFPSAGFQGKAHRYPGTQELRMSTGLELQVLLPVVNAPFRVYWAYNPLRVHEYLAAADRSGPFDFPEPGDLPECYRCLSAMLIRSSSSTRCSASPSAGPSEARRPPRLQYVSIETNSRSFSLTKNCIFTSRPGAGRSHAAHAADRDRGPAPPNKVGIIHIQNAIISTKDGQKAACRTDQPGSPRKSPIWKRSRAISRNCRISFARAATP